MSASEAAEETAVTWLSECHDGEKLLARVGRQGRLLVAEFPGTGILFVDSLHGQMSFRPDALAASEAVAKLEQGLIPALLRHAQGKLTLHAAAVCIEGEAIALLGPSGTGKSTLAGAVCQSASALLVADDTLAIEFSKRSGGTDVLSVLPTQNMIWLLSDARAALGLDVTTPHTKMPHKIARCTDPVRLRAVVALRFDEQAPRIRRIHGHDALAALSQSAIRLIVDDPQAQLREFDQLTTLTASCAVYELSRPRDLGVLQVSA